MSYIDAQVTRISKLSQKNNRTVFEILASLGEEFGELSTALLVENGKKQRELKEDSKSEVVDVIVTALDLFFKLGGNELELERVIQSKTSKWEESLPNPKNDAVERAMEMMFIPQNKLPRMALEYAHYLGKQIGLCMEVYITAYAAYAQVVEGLPCHDDLYDARPDAVVFFQERMKNEPTN